MPPWVRIDRDKTREKKKYGAVELATWDAENIKKFMNEYARQERTAERYFDDVNVCDPLHTIIKGPLTPTAEIAFESYFGIYLVGNDVAAKLYAKHPALMIPNEQGIPELPRADPRVASRPGSQRLGRDAPQLTRCPAGATALPQVEDAQMSTPRVRRGERHRRRPRAAE